MWSSGEVGVKNRPILRPPRLKSNGDVLILVLHNCVAENSGADPWLDGFRKYLLQTELSLPGLFYPVDLQADLAGLDGHFEFSS
jgi:hypothetical protein